MADPIIHDGNYEEFLRPGGCGLIPRDFAAQPHGSLMYAKAFDLPLIPREEWNDRLAAQKAAKASLIDIRARAMDGQEMPALDQGNKGYCWAHSTCNAVRYVRALNFQPWADISPYSVACMVKNFRNQGGWCGESLEFVTERGVATSEFWPQRSMDRSNDNPKTWENAAKYKIIEWMDCDPEQMEEQLVTCLLLNIPVPSDFNYWGHSVCSIAVESFVGTGKNTRLDESWIDNSWGSSWGTRGMGKLKGRKAIPNSAVAPRVVLAAA